MSVEPSTLDSLSRFHRTLVEEILRTRPAYLSEPFTVSEIYQNLVPYQTHRGRMGVQMNGDYEDILLRLLAGEGDYLVLESEHARSEIEEEFRSPSPNTGLYREYAAVDVRLNPLRRPRDLPDPRPCGTPAGEVAPVPVLPSASSEAPPTPRAATPELPSQALSAEPLKEDPPAFEPAASQGRAESVSPPAPGSGVMAHCAWCQETLPERDMLKYCPFCGADLDKAPCPTCGEELEVSWRFCVACGTAVGDPT